ncbi:hypothetical protein C6N75_20900 [Streptomyces solincola]|uniref:DUF8129 domain-containing protein n=1 Tax=Streptomyces solincola TaxID=2100817 RepID=A0A2S9PSC8_9ACTN|nr:hypothetical protein [Streptomyces solincola]PRH77326.1 hypothetical protein C6N75_20900 [Streptomyces solincola]
MTASDRAGLPLPDYDTLSVGTLEHRIRGLGSDDVEKLLHYEHTHGDRAMVVQVLASRKHQIEEGG